MLKLHKVRWFSRIRPWREITAITENQSTRPVKATIMDNTDDTDNIGSSLLRDLCSLQSQPQGHKFTARAKHDLTQETYAWTQIFGVRFERRKVDEKQTYRKTEVYKLYSRVFWIFLPNVIKIDPYNFEVYRFKVCAFFSETHVVDILPTTPRNPREYPRNYSLYF